MAQCPLHHGWLVLLKTGACCGLSIFFEVTTNWRAGCQKLACPVRREGRPESSSLPLSLSEARHTAYAPNRERRTAPSLSDARMLLDIFGWSFQLFPVGGGVQAEFYSSEESRGSREQIVCRN